MLVQFFTGLSILLGTNNVVSAYNAQDVQVGVEDLNARSDAPASSSSNGEVSPHQPLAHLRDHLQVFGSNVENFGREMLRQAVESRPSEKFAQLRAAMEQLVNHTAALRDTLEKHNITSGEVSEKLGSVFATIVDGLKEAFPPTDKAPSHAERTAMVSYVLDRAQLALVNLGVQQGVDETVLTDHCTVIRNHTQALIVAVGDLIEQHPVLFDILVFSVSAMLIPEQWLLRPLFSLFGFGPAGPVKGSAAAGMQRLFWGAAVKEGSWFSFLQRAGMKRSFPPGTSKAIMGGVGAAVGVGVGAVKSYFGSST